MKSFDYVRPASTAEAIAAAAEPGSAYLAGGTNLLDLMKIGVARPGRIIDISRLSDLSQIERLSDGSTRIGALVRNADLAHNVDFSRSYPSVAEALLSGASGQIRNAATVGGNVLQQPRCHYYFDTAAHCNKRKPGTGCDAKHGENRLHAVLGWSDACIATHPSDFAVPLVALDTVVEIEGSNGRREIALEQLYRLPGDDPSQGTELTRDELIVALRLPPSAQAFNANSRYLKIRERTSYAFAVVSVSASLRLNAGKIAEARIAIGGVASKPWRCNDAEGVLAGQPCEAQFFQRAADIALSGAKPSGDNAFKIELAKRLIVRAMTAAATGTPARVPALPGSPFSSVAGVQS